MSSHDDRKDFEAETRRQAILLGQDTAAFNRSKDTLLDLDRFRYSYLWTWLGIPIIQLPADVMATQEVIWKTRPDVIVECGVARGGSLIFMASILEILGHGVVLGVDVDIRKHNRSSIEDHPLSHRIKLIEGSSTSENTLSAVRANIPDKARVMVVLDSDHSRSHVLAELRSYGPMVTKDCYLVVADTLVGFLTASEAPSKRSQILFKGNDPLSARDDFLSECDRFEVDEALNGKLVLASSPGGYLRCIKD